MSGAVHHALLGLASASLLAAGHRVAAGMTERTLERLIAGFVFAAAAAVAEALALGLVGAGSDAVVLTIAAMLTFAAARATTPRPAPPTLELLAARWEALDRRERAAAGALTAAALVVLAWPLYRPVIGFDGAVYHLPEIAGWVASGRPGAIDQVSYLFPFANYPVTNEVALTWAMGISRSLVPLVAWTQVLLVVTAAASALGLEALGVRRAILAVTVAAVLATPVLLTQVGTPSTDVAGLAWLTCTAALAACARRRAALASPALLAAGLAVGTKTTTVPLALVVIAASAWALPRPAWRAHRWALAACGAAALVVGGTWYLRNAVTHGSPVWPFRSLPGGDPVPRVWNLIDPSLLSRPRATLSGRASGYVDLFGGAVVLGVAAALSWLVDRRREVLAASAVTVLAALLWAAAPSTGRPNTPVFEVNVLSTTRYAIPVVAAAAVAVALAAAGRRAVLAVPVAALAWSLIRDRELEQPSLPGLAGLLAAAVAGGLLGAAMARPLRAPGWGAGPGLALLAGAALALPAHGLLRRQAEVAPRIPGTPAASWARAQPAFDAPGSIHFAGTVIGQFAGDRLQHRLVLVDAAAPCAEVRRLAERHLVVVADEEVFRRLGVATPAGCLAGMAPSYADPGVRVYGRL